MPFTSLMHIVLASGKIVRQQKCIVVVDTDRVPGISRKMVFQASLTRLFFIFCQIFGMFGNFSKLYSILGVLHFEKIIKYARRKLKRSLVQLALNSARHFQKPKPRVWVIPDLLVVARLRQSKINNFLHAFLTLWSLFEK